MKKYFFFLLSAILMLPLHADEGMWMLNKIDQQTAETMKNLGLELTPRELYNPDGLSLKDAVVDFGDFCSGVVVSPYGLVFTNHHCGYSSIQRLATPDDDILTNGFVAHSYAEERPAEGLFVRFLQRTEECSGRVMRALDAEYKANPGVPTSSIDRLKVDSICRQVEREYSAANPGLDCQVKSYYGGNAYYVSIYKVYPDVRLVFAPTETMGKFGGDTDNWMWPRQTCDFSVFRIYADANGEPAEYSPDNVPYRPKRYAQVSIEGYQPGDFCMTIGYPGSTSRYLSSWGIGERVNDRNISTIQVRGKKQEVWKKWMDQDRVIALKYASKWAGSSNYWKNSIGMNKAIEDLDVIGQKQKLEGSVRNWYESNPETQRRFSSVFPQLESSYAERRQNVRTTGFYTETFQRGIEINRVAGILNRTPNNISSEQKEATKEQLAAFFKDYDARVDEETTATLLQNYREQVGDTTYPPSLYARIDSLYGGDCAAYAHDLFSKTICTRPDCLDRLLADSTLRDTDPALVLADEVQTGLSMLYMAARDANVQISYNERLLTQALLEMEQQTPHYSDANFSMRLSYGFVQDYTAQGQHFDYYTPSQSLLDKAAQQAQNEDYKLEDPLVDLMQRAQWGPYADRRTNDLHLCFISNNDITGGNSGSPMFNGRGELIGLAFDGNWEAMSGDISFDPSLQRCIGVDIRFVLYLIDRWGGASNVIKELGLKK